MGKKKDDKLTQMGLESYYRTLCRGDRGKVLLYVASFLGISYPSVHGKFMGRQKFSTAELMVLEPIIKNELWKQ